MLPSLSSRKDRPKGIPDRQWCAPKFATLVQEQCVDNDNGTLVTLPRYGFVDPDGYSSYANSVMQCLLHSKVVRNVFRVGDLDFLVQLVKKL